MATNVLCRNFVSSTSTSFGPLDKIIAKLATTEMANNIPAALLSLLQAKLVFIEGDVARLGSFL